MHHLPSGLASLDAWSLNATSAYSGKSLMPLIGHRTTFCHPAKQSFADRRSQAGAWERDVEPTVWLAVHYELS